MSMATFVVTLVFLATNAALIPDFVVPVFLVLSMFSSVVVCTEVAVVGIIIVVVGKAQPNDG